MPDFDLTGVVNDNVEELREEFCDSLKDEVEEHPCILFMDEFDETLKEQISVTGNLIGVHFEHIKNEHDALAAQQMYLDQVKVVLLIERTWARAYDIKLGADATVMIFAVGSGERQLPWPEA